MLRVEKKSGPGVGRGGQGEEEEAGLFVHPLCRLSCSNNFIIKVSSNLESTAHLFLSINLSVHQFFGGRKPLSKHDFRN